MWFIIYLSVDDAKRQILLLVGLLQHTSKDICCGQFFVACMYAKAAKVKQLDYFTRLGTEFRSDLAWWHTYLEIWNGLSMLRALDLIHQTA